MIIWIIRLILFGLILFKCIFDKYDVGIFGLGGVVGDAHLGQKPTCT
jgi:hypothetical protein